MNPSQMKIFHLFKLVTFPLTIALALVWIFISGVDTSVKGMQAEDAAVQGLPVSLPAPTDVSTPGTVVMSNDGRVVELEFNTPKYTLETVSRASGVCQTVEVPGLTDQRNPAEVNLPTGGAWLGVPPTGEPALTLLHSTPQIIQLKYGLCPVTAPAQDDSVEGSSILLRNTSQDALRIAAASGFLPGSTAEIISTSFMRSQRITMLRFSPFQYNPATNELRYYPKLRVQIRLPDFSNNATAASEMHSEGPFEEIYRTSLLNYEQAKKWRLTPQRAAVQSGIVPAPGRQISGVESPAPEFKLVVDQDGVYTVTYEKLQAAGADVNLIDPRYFSLTNRGNPVAIQVVTALEDQFQPSDYILFYGQKATTKYTYENIYWLSWNSPGGARIGTVDSSPTHGYDKADSYTQTVRLEQNLLYRGAYPSGPDHDHWYWMIAYATASNPPKPPVAYSFTFSIDHLASTPVTETIKGLFKSLVGNPRHHTQIYLNNQAIGDYFWDQGTELAFTQTFSSSYLIQGTNVISMVIPLDYGITSETFFVNWFEVTYHRQHSATGNLLDYTSNSQPAQYAMSGFSSSDIQMLDISEPAQPNWVTGAQIEGSDPSYTATIEQADPQALRYLAFTHSTIRSPKAIIKDIPSDLHSLDNSADYVVISPSVFSQSIQSLLTYRETQGMRVALVDLQDIFDEFNYGILDPNAIHEFLAYAYANWSAPAPMYVLLVGDGHYDFLNYYGYNNPNYMPPLLGEYDLWIGETVSDNRLVAFDGSIMPSMFIGRLPVNSTAELTSMINKILAYEQTPVAAWMQNVTFVADQYDPSVGASFYDLSDDIADHELPVPYVGDKIYYKQGYDTATAVRNAIKADINSGRLMVSYVGHGATTYWAAAKLFAKADINALTNTGKYPIIVPMTCLDGYFIEPPGSNYSSIGETFVRADSKGAVASFSPSGYGLVSAHDQLERGFFRAFFEDYVNELGPATTQAKYAMMVSSGGLFTDTVDTFLLLGDPATRVPIISNFHPNPGISMTGQKLEPTGSDYYVQYTIRFTNTGTGQAAHVVISDTLPAELEFSSAISSGIIITQTSTSPLNFSVKNMSPNSSGALTITARVLPGYSGMLENVAEITTVGELETTLADNRARVDISIESPDVSISVAADISGALPPFYITYTLNYTNIGQEIARDVGLTFTLPTSIENIQIITTGATLTQVSVVPLVYQVADLGIGEGGAITVTAEVINGICGSLAATGAIQSNGDAFSQTSNNFSEAIGDVPCPDLTVSLSPALETENYPHYHVIFPLYYANIGHNIAQGVMLTYTLPSEIENIEIITSGAVLTQVSAIPLVYQVADLGVSDGGAITVTADVSEGFCGMLVGSGAIDSSGDPFSPSSNNFTSAELEIPCPDVMVSMAPLLDAQGIPPYHVTFPLNYANIGQSIARGVVLTDTLPSAIENIQIITSGATLTQVSTVPLVYQVADLGVGDGGTVTVTADVIEGFCGRLVGSGAIHSIGDPFSPSSNNYAAGELVIPCPDVMVSLVSSKDSSIFPPHSVTYTIQFSNIGQGIAQGVAVTNTLPASIENIQVVTSGATMTQISTVPLVFDVADLATGEGGTITITADVEDGFWGPLHNWVEINATGDAVGPNGNNFADSLLQIFFRLVFPIVQKR